MSFANRNTPYVLLIWNFNICGYILTASTIDHSKKDGDMSILR